jgi:hypothetical protein
MTTPTHITFQGKDPQEQFQFYFRQHWIRLLKPFLIALLETSVLVGLGIVFFWTEPTSQLVRGICMVALLLFFLAVQWRFLQRFYAYFLSMIIVTNQKIHRIKKTLFSVDDHQMISLWALQEIKKSQRGPIQNLLGFGTIIMEAQDTQLRIHFVPRITHHYQEILELLGMNSGQTLTPTAYGTPKKKPNEKN